MIGGIDGIDNPDIAGRTGHSSEIRLKRTFLDGGTREEDLNLGKFHAGALRKSENSTATTIRISLHLSLRGNQEGKVIDDSAVNEHLALLIGV